MAVYVRHVLSTEAPKILENSVKSVQILSVRWSSHSKKVKKLPLRFIPNVKVQSKIDSISSKGFLRNIVTYQPPKDASKKLYRLFHEIVGSRDLDCAINLEKKFQLLSALSVEFSYTVPNSLLHRMINLGRIYEFYTTPVQNIIPYDKLKEVDLPPNLHILFDYHRFHPDTDTMFDGVTAFPKHSTIVTGLKAKEKYKGYDAGSPWKDI